MDFDVVRAAYRRDGIKLRSHLRKKRATKSINF